MGDLGTYTLGGSYLNQRGVNPAEKLNRLNLNGNVNMPLSRWLQSTTSVQRIRSNNPYQDDSFSGIDHTLINMPPTLEHHGMVIMPDGTPVFLSERHAAAAVAAVADRQRVQQGADEPLDRVAAVLASTWGRGST